MAHAASTKPPADLPSHLRRTTVACDVALEEGKNIMLKTLCIVGAMLTPVAVMAQAQTLGTNSRPYPAAEPQQTLEFDYGKHWFFMTDHPAIDVYMAGPTSIRRTQSPYPMEVFKLTSGPRAGVRMECAPGARLRGPFRIINPDGSTLLELTSESAAIECNKD